MPIAFDEKNKIFYLHSKACTYAFGINEMGVPEHIYFGGRTERILAMGGYSEEGRCHPIRRKPGPGRGYLNIGQAMRDLAEDVESTGRMFSEM